MSTGSQDIREKSPPRVHIYYTDPITSKPQTELPFAMGIMSDLSGNAGKEKEKIVDRDFTQVDANGLDVFVKSIEPGVAMMVDDRLSGTAGAKLGVTLKFTKMADFEPGAIAAQVPALNSLLTQRRQLNDLVMYLISKPDAQNQIADLLGDPQKLSVFADQIRAERAASAAAQDEQTDDATPTEA